MVAAIPGARSRCGFPSAAFWPNGGGEGDNVVPVHIAEETEVRWEMQTDGPFLSAQLLGFGDAEGTEQFLGILQGGLAFEPSNRGFRSDSALPGGDYLLVVDADGRWAVRFFPID